MPVVHGLGSGAGKLIEYEDGTVAYKKPGSFSQAFRVSIGDVSGFAVTNGGKTFNLLGNGTTLATCEVNGGVAETIEKWFDGHPQFKRAASSVAVPPPTPVVDAPPVFIADELRKLAELRDIGVLTEDEFAAQKAKLLAR
jgi:hypothetical protein